MADTGGQRQDLPLNDDTRRIIGAFYHVYDTLGYGLLETVYRNSLAITLRKYGFVVTSEAPVDAWFEGERVGVFRADLIVDGAIVLELKVASSIHPIHEVQLVNYLKASGLQLGFVFNFGPKPTFKRRVFTR